MDTTTASPKTGRRWLRLLVLIFLGFFSLLVVAYFVATSGAFFKGVILPRVSEALHAEVTVADASISPFSQVVLQNLKVQPKGGEPIFTAQKVTARYDLKAILGGNLVVHEATVDSPVVNIVQQADGSSNLDPMLKGGQPKSAPEPSKGPTPAASTPRLNVAKVAINNGQVHLVQNGAAKARKEIDLSQVNFSLQNLKNGQEAKMTFSSQLKLEDHPASGTNGNLSATAAGDFTFKLSPELKPDAVQGAAQVEVKSAGGTFADFQAVAATLKTEMTPTELKSVLLQVARQQTTLAELRVSGPLDSAKMEGHLTVALSSIDRRLLNLVGGPQGLDFGGTTLSVTNHIDLAQGGSVIRTEGGVNIGKLSVTQKGKTTPAVDLVLAYDTTVNRSRETLQLQKFDLQGTQNGVALLRGSLTSPMQIGWGNASNAVGDSALDLILTNLDLAAWQPLMGDTQLAGKVGAHLKMLAKEAGADITLELDSTVADLATLVGTNPVSQANARLQAGLGIKQQRFVSLRNLDLQLSRQNIPILSSKTTGSADLTTQNADLQFGFDTSLPGLLATLPQPDTSASSGTVTLQARITQTNKLQTVVGSFGLADFTGRYGEYLLTNFGTKARLDIAADPAKVEIRTLAGSISSEGADGGGFSVAGRYQIEKAAFDGGLGLTNLNEHALRPFLAPALGSNRMVSISVNGNATAQTASGGATTAKADFKLANFVVHPVGQPKPNPALEARLQADIAQTLTVTDLRQVQLNLTPTARAKNQLELTGRLDRSDTNTTQGNLKMVAASLDLTPYYDLFAAAPQPGNPPPSAPPPTAKPASGKPAAAPAPSEPEPVTLPLKNFGVLVDIGALYLRELQITNWQTALQVDGGRVQLQPLQLALNGAPVRGSMKLNLGVPGYEYDVAFDTGLIPLEPIANTFLPEERGNYKGDLSAHAQLKGAGVSGVNLRKSLAGTLAFSFTNANIQIIQPKLKRFLTPIALLLGAPELIGTPLNFVNLNGQAGTGKIEISQFSLVSPAFKAETKGQIPIADDLMKSPLNGWPVEFSLEQSLAAKLKLAPKDPTPGVPYVLLPNFVSVVGTLEEPTAKLDKLALTGSVLEKFGDKIPGVDAKTGAAIKSLGGLLGGSKTSTNNSASTNAPAGTNQPPPAKFNPLDLLKKPKK